MSALWVANGSTVYINGSSFTNNTSNNNSTIWIGAPSTGANSLIVNNISFTGNKAVNGNIRNGGTLEIKNGSFTNNSDIESRNIKNIGRRNVFKYCWAIWRSYI